jgi:tRNA nucleotidyltransferase (CCA-adding enzyme)
MNYKQIEKSVLQRVTPTKDYREKLEQNIKELEQKIENEIQKKHLPVEIELVGSTAKDTYLQGNLDIDFFLKFPTTFSKEKIAENALSIGKKLLTKTEESYAEHPYLRGYYKEYKTEIVPCYKIEKASQKLSAVDRTPLHTKYVKKHLKEKQKQEVRLLKQFLKGIGCYGAEAEIEGFSGYLCEILIIKYGTFQQLIKNATNWKNGIKLYLKPGKNPDFDTPLVFIDPVDNNRNVASALTKNKFQLFIKACKDYQSKPQITYFFPNPVKPWTKEQIKKHIQKPEYKYLGLKTTKPDIIPENLYPQIRKATRSIKDACKRNDFKIKDITFHVNQKSIYIIIKTENKNLPEIKTHTGPPANLKKNTQEFIKKWENNPLVKKGPYEKNSRLYVDIKRQYTNIEKFLKNNLKTLSLGKHLDKIFMKKVEIQKNNELLTENLRVFWTQYFDGKKSWER